jgi:hypothetical protein
LALAVAFLGVAMFFALGFGRFGMDDDDNDGWL